MIALMVNSMYAQKTQEQGSFHFGYKFRSKHFSPTDTNLYVLKATKVAYTDTVGYFTDSSGIAHYIKKNTTKTQTKYEPRAIKTQLKGVISSRNNDTLFINFWNITDSIGYKNSTVLGRKVKLIDSVDNGNDFAFVVREEDWKQCIVRFCKKKYALSYPHFDVPYHYGQLIATSIPFRVIKGDDKKSKLESEFLNANVSYIWAWGITRFYKSEFVPPRNFCMVGIGPFFGLTAIDIDSNKKSSFGINYGLNVMAGLQNVNFVIAVGAQNGFQKGAGFEPYIGFGIGYKLIGEIFSPEIKDKNN